MQVSVRVFINNHTCDAVPTNHHSDKMQIFSSHETVLCINLNTLNHNTYKLSKKGNLL